MCQKRETTAMDFNVLVIRKQMWLDVYLIFQLSRALGSWESQLFKKYEYCTCDAAIVWLSGCIFIQSQTYISLMEDAHLLGYKMRSFYDACENRVYTILGEKMFSWWQTSITWPAPRVNDDCKIKSSAWLKTSINFHRVKIPILQVR